MSTSIPALLLASGVSILSVIAPSPTHAASCADLVKLKIPYTEIAARAHRKSINQQRMTMAA